MTSLSINRSSSSSVVSTNGSGYPTSAFSILSLPDGSSRVDTLGEREKVFDFCFAISHSIFPKATKRGRVIDGFQTISPGMKRIVWDHSPSKDLDTILSSLDGLLNPVNAQSRSTDVVHNTVDSSIVDANVFDQ